MRNVNYVKADGTMVKTLAEAGKGAKVKLTEERKIISEKTKALAKKRVQALREKAK